MEDKIPEGFNWVETGALLGFFITIMYMVVKGFNWIKDQGTQWIPKLANGILEMMHGVTESSKQSAVSSQQASNASQEAVAAIKKLVETDVAMSAIIADMGRDTRKGFNKISEAARPLGRALVLLAPENHRNEVQSLVNQIENILDKDD